MAAKYLISKTDIQVYRPTAVLDDERIKPFILEAQTLDLKPVLNDALFLQFINKFDQTLDPLYARYQDLLKGKEYSYNGQTILFDGIKPMLSYFSLARFIANNPLNITRMGVVVKTPQQSEPADSVMIRACINELRSAAISYQSQVIQFLQYNIATYPLYANGESSNAGNKTAYKIFKL
jgi:hypothetical protein